MRFGGTVLLNALILVASGCVHYGGPPTESLPEPESRIVAGTYVHEPSGMTFPVSVGEFRREKVTRYDTEGLDISVGYNLFLPPRAIAATVYVYPSPPCASLGGSAASIRPMMEELAGQEFERRKAEVLRAHPGGRMVSEGDFVLTRQGVDRTGRKATFEYEGSLARVRQPLASELYMFCYVGERWTVKFRFTHPSGVDAAPDIEQLIGNLEWTFSNP